MEKIIKSGLILLISLFVISNSFSQEYIRVTPSEIHHSKDPIKFENYYFFDFQTDILEQVKHKNLTIAFNIETQSNTPITERIKVVAQTGYAHNYTEDETVPYSDGLVFLNVSTQNLPFLRICICFNGVDDYITLTNVKLVFNDRKI